MSAKNVSQKVFPRKEMITVGKLNEWMTSGLMTCDPDFLQRLLNESSWDILRMIAYTSGLFDGGNLSTPFLIVELEPTITLFKEKIANHPKDSKNEQEVLDHLISFTKPDIPNGRKIGAKYLLIDGQHRSHCIMSYISDGFYFEPKEEIDNQIDDSKGTVKFEGYYSNLEEEQQELFLNIPLDCTFYSTNSMSALTKIFIGANSGVQMTDHEKRIINYNASNKWVISLCNKTVDLANLLEKIKKPKHYKPVHKGDTYLVCELLLWNMDAYYEFGEKELDEAFGMYPTNNWVPSKSDYELTEKVIRNVVYGCAEYMKMGYSIKDYSIASIHNLAYTISYLLDTSNKIVQDYSGEAHNKSKLNGEYNILDKGRFAEWFFDYETERLSVGLEDTGMTDSYGDPIMEFSDYSFKSHNADNKHRRKRSTKGVGDSKYTFPNYARLRYLLADLEKHLPKLIADGIIVKVGSRTSVDKYVVATKQGLKKSDVQGKHFDHVYSSADGYDITAENGRFIKPDQNTSKGAEPGIFVDA